MSAALTPPTELDPPVAGRLHELCRRYGLDQAAERSLAALLMALAAAPHAPSAVRAPERAIDVHLADSLSALEVGAVRGVNTAADLGSGAGFPGLALAAAMPAADWKLVESAARKCEFIADAATAAALGNVEAVWARAELWTAGIGMCDLVTSRALAPLAVVAEYAAPLLRLGGSLVAWKGVRDAGEEAAGQGAARKLGLEPAEVRRAEPYPGARNRHLYVYLKVRDTPERFPRKPGIARKRPLGGSA